MISTKPYEKFVKWQVSRGDIKADDIKSYVLEYQKHVEQETCNHSFEIVGDKRKCGLCGLVEEIGTVL